MNKRLRVPPHRYRATIREWANKGLRVVESDDTWVIMERPPHPPRTFWRALKLSALTLGAYPIGILLWWLMAAWWVKPIIAATRVDKITIETD